MENTTPAWVQDAIFYQIFPDRFARGSQGPQVPAENLQPWGAQPTLHGFQGGDLFGVVEKLDYLQALGVNALYLNPIFASTANHRYHTHDYFEVDPLLGGDKGFALLMSETGRRNMRVVLDGVFNHASRGFYYFNHLLESGPESPYVDWFHVQDWPLNAYEAEPNYAAWWNISALPKFNTSNPAVREYLWSVGEYWLKQGIAGWRLDVPEEIDDDDFWRTFRQRCRAINPECYLVGELWHDAGRWLQGDIFDAQMNYPFARAGLSFFGGDNVNHEVITPTGLGQIAPRDGVAFAQELARLHSHYPPHITNAQLTMLGSHDTARILTMLNEDKEALRLLFLCQMTVAGAPNIYYGDEIGMSGGLEPESRRAFPWDEPEQWDESLLAAVRHYTQLRHTVPALRRGDFTPLYGGPDVVIYRRQEESSLAIIAFNRGDTAVTVPPLAAELLGAEQLPPALEETEEVLTAGQPVHLPACSGRVWAITSS